MVGDEFCPVAEAAKLLGDTWRLLILRDLAAGPRRFMELEHTVTGISPSTLSSRLRDLEHEGMVTRTSYNEIPPRVEYALREKGHDALGVIEALRAYGAKWLARHPCSALQPPVVEVSARDDSTDQAGYPDGEQAGEDAERSATGGR